MRHHAISIRVFAVSCGLWASAGAAQAAIETWVSGTGTDAGTCPRTAPCRTFAFAHTQTNNNGAINVLTAGNFGPVTITKPISIVADGVEAVINTGADGAGIIVQAGSAAIVSLRGLTIDLRGTVNNGVWFLSGGALHVQDCVIRKATSGIEFVPGTGTSELYVADSVIADVGGIGILVSPSGSSSATVVLERVRVENGAFHGISFAGHLTTGSITATVRDSVVAGNVSTGILAFEGGGGTTTATVSRTAAMNNSIGISADIAGATIRIGDSTVSGNGTGLSAANSGVIDSYGTNKVDGNGADGAPTSTIPMK